MQKGINDCYNFVICSAAYNKALEDAVAVLIKIAMRIDSWDCNFFLLN